MGRLNRPEGRRRWRRWRRRRWREITHRRLRTTTTGALAACRYRGRRRWCLTRARPLQRRGGGAAAGPPHLNQRRTSLLFPQHQGGSKKATWQVQRNFMCLSGSHLPPMTYCAAPPASPRTPAQPPHSLRGAACASAPSPSARSAFQRLCTTHML